MRELKNVLERAILLHDEEYVQPHHVQFGQSNGSSQKDLSPPARQNQRYRPEASVTESISLLELERGAILNALVQSERNQSKAARLLKISRDTLRYRMRKHGLT